MIDPGAVSVIVPTRNRPQRTVRALASVAAQTAAPGQVVVCDDGSSDDTVATILAWKAATRLPFPVLLLRHDQSKGVSAARNACARECSGDWLAFLDSDDEWQPAKLERQMEVVEDRPGFRVCHTDEIWIRDGRRVNPRRRHRKYGGYIFEHCLPLCAMSPSSVVISRRLLHDVGGFDEDLPACEDYDLWLRICAQEPVVLLREPLVVKYGGHEDQLSRQYWGMDRFRIRALVKLLVSRALSEERELSVRQTLRAKVAVYLGGVRKRGRHEEEHELGQLLEQVGEALP